MVQNETMAQLLNFRCLKPSPIQNLARSSSTSYESPRSQLSSASLCRKANTRTWPSLRRELECNGRYYCLFSNNRKQDEARKALESALDEEKNESEKWDKEIKKRVEVGGGGDVGRGGSSGSGGGWFGSGGGFGWSNGDNSWSEAQQTSLAVLGLIIMYLIVAKGEVLVAGILSQLMFVLRVPRKWLSLIRSKIFGKSPKRRIDSGNMTKNEAFKHVSAKERVVAKWGSD